MPPAGGVAVEFRDNASEDLLWCAVMNYIPSKDDLCKWTDTHKVTRTYEVQSVLYEFISPIPIGESPQTNCQNTPVVYVTEQ